MPNPRRSLQHLSRGIVSRLLAGGPEGVPPAAVCDNVALASEFQHGIDLINQGSYFAAHDALEEVWRGIHGWTKPFYQGMVQVAISLHHFSTGNLVGAQSVLKKSRANLAEFPVSFCGVDLAGLQSQLESWQSAMANGGPYPPQVHIQYTPPEC